METQERKERKPKGLHSLTGSEPLSWASKAINTPIVGQPYAHWDTENRLALSLKNLEATPAPNPMRARRTATNHIACNFFIFRIISR